MDLSKEIVEELAHRFGKCLTTADFNLVSFREYLEGRLNPQPVGDVKELLEKFDSHHLTILAANEDEAALMKADLQALRKAIADLQKQVTALRERQYKPGAIQFALDTLADKYELRGTVAYEALAELTDLRKLLGELAEREDMVSKYQDTSCGHCGATPTGSFEDPCTNPDCSAVRARAKLEDPNE